MRWLAAVGVIAVVVIIAAGIYFFGGFYNVSAAVDDPDLMNWTLVHIREASINRRADATPPIKLDDPATIRKGAIEFAEHGCANCHGAPGVKWAKFSEGLNPGPPDLKESMSDEAPAHVFWVVSNGIKMTAMPSFSKNQGVPDEDIWKSWPSSRICRTSLRRTTKPGPHRRPLWLRLPPHKTCRPLLRTQLRQRSHK